MKRGGIQRVASFGVLGALAGWAVMARGDDSLPKALPAGKYDAMVQRSPFTVPSGPAPAPPPPPVAAGPHWWDQMFVTSLMDRGGVYYAAVVDKANNKHYVLQLNKLDPDSQLLLGGVQWNDRVEQTTVTVSRGAETAPPLRFDAAAANPAPVRPTGVLPPPTAPGSNPVQHPTLPPGFAGTPPPPPPSAPSVVRRVPPINSPPNGVRNRPDGAPRRIIVPSSSDEDN